MTASADKVQFILQSSLQQTLPLVKKGIFSQQQLRQVMMERQKHQNKLYSYTFKLSHHLKAIQFEYDLQRQRLYRIKNQQQQNTNPMFRKQGKTDFSVVRRIIKLWDRTMHKYRFRAYLWKQYLSFCIIIKSKKHFYKALTNALRFLPFEVQLWKIGVRYQVEVGRNLWKARKLFYKALKLVPVGERSVELTKQLIKFQLQFVEMLQARERIIKGEDGGDNNDMKFIIGDQQQQNKQQQQDNNLSNEQQQQGTFIAPKSQQLKLREYHEILFVALVDSITKNYKSASYFHNRTDLSSMQRCQKLCDMYLRFLEQLKMNQHDEVVGHVLQVTMRKLKDYKSELGGVKLQEKYQQEKQLRLQQQDGEDRIQVQQQQQQVLAQENNDLMIQQQPQLLPEVKPQQLSKQQLIASSIFQTYNQTQKFDQKLFNKSIKQLCLKPLQLSELLEQLFVQFFSECLNVLKKNDWLRVPIKCLEHILRRFNQQSLLTQQQGDNMINNIYTSYLLKQFQKINPTQYMTNTGLLKQVILYNRHMNRIEQNNKLFRSLLVNCKQNIQFIERAKGLFVI